VALSRKDQTVQIWDAASGKLQRTLTGFKEPPAMYWSPDGRRLLLTDRGKTASVWSAQTGAKLCELIGLRRDILGAKWSPDGKTIMLMTRDDGMKANWLDKEKTEAHLWDAETGQLQFTLRMKWVIAEAEFSPGRQQILTAGVQEDAKLWDAITGQLQATLRPTPRSIYKGSSGIFSPDGRFIAVDSYGRGINLWEAATGKLQAAVVEHEFGENNYTLRGFSPDGKLLAIYREHLKGLGKTESSIELRDGVTGKLRVALTGRNMRDSAHQVVWCPDGQTLVTAGGSRKYEGKIWDTATGQLRATFPMVAKAEWGGGYSDLDRLLFHPTLPVLSAASNNFIRFLNPANGELLQTLETSGFHTQWSADGQRLVTLAKDWKSVQIWELVER
jgi:WD40 repeat protein